MNPQQQVQEINLPDVYAYLKNKLMVFDDPACIDTDIVMAGKKFKCVVIDAFDAKLNHNMDFTEGDNGWHEKWDVPKDVLCASSDSPPFERKFNLMHEAIESLMMWLAGYDYNHAHDVANAYEKMFRLEYANRRPDMDRRYYRLRNGKLVNP